MTLLQRRTGGLGKNFVEACIKALAAVGYLSIAEALVSLAAQCSEYHDDLPEQIATSELSMPLVASF
jgi:hypothetical protein